MNITKLSLTILSLILFNTGFSQSKLDNYISNFSYENRKEMKVSSEEIVQLLVNEGALLVDIRFEEEHAAWGMDYALQMTLSSLPQRYQELPKNKLIVTACPHKDRAIMAMLYLQSKGYKAAYLKDGLLGLADYLRGDNAQNFIKNLKNK